MPNGGPFLFTAFLGVALGTAVYFGLHYLYDLFESNEPQGYHGEGGPRPGSRPRSRSRSGHMDDTCVICQESIGRRQEMILNCTHCFHLECIQNWQRSSRTCPLCRGPV